MIVQCSVLESPLHSATESACRALNGNQDTPSIYVIRMFAEATLPFGTDIFSLRWVDGTTGDPLQDAVNTEEYYLTHIWGEDLSSFGSGEFLQEDDIDPTTWVGSEKYLANSGFTPPLPDPPTFDSSPFGVIGGDRAAELNANAGSQIATSAGANKLTNGSVYSDLLQAIASLDLTDIWNGRQLTAADSSNPSWQDPRQAGNSIYRFAKNTPGAGLQGIGVPGPDGRVWGLLGNGISTNVVAGTSGILSGAGVLAKTTSANRCQVQIRNFTVHSPIAYNFIESASVWKPDPNNPSGPYIGDIWVSPAPGGDYFVQNNQIVEIPQPRITGFPTKTAVGGGTAVIRQMQVDMIVNMTAQEYCQKTGFRLVQGW